MVFMMLFYYVPKGASGKGKADVPLESLHVASVEIQTDDCTPTGYQLS